MTDRLKVSDRYEAFIKAPTGIIERFSGHRGYSTSLSSPIDEGDSWQLGTLIAHILSENGLLPNRERPAQRLIWASGIVEHDIDAEDPDDPDDLNLVVRPIQYLETKLDHAAALFDKCRTEKLPLIIVLPKANVTDSIRQKIEEYAPHAELIQYDRILLRSLMQDWGAGQVEGVETDLATPKPRPARRPFWFWPAIGVSGLVAMGFIGAVTNAISSPRPVDPRPTIGSDGNVAEANHNETVLATTGAKTGNLLDNLVINRILIKATNAPNQNCFASVPDAVNSSSLGLTPSSISALDPITFTGRICAIRAVDFTNATNVSLSLQLILSSSRQPLSSASATNPSALVPSGESVTLSYGGRSLADGESVSLQIQDSSDAQRFHLIPIAVAN